MQLTVMECFKLLDLLPQQGSYSDLKLIRHTREALTDFTDKERNHLQFRDGYFCPVCDLKKDNIVFSPDPIRCGCGTYMSTSGKITCTDWEYQRDIELAPYIKAKLITALKKMSDEQRLSDDMIGLYEKFVEGEK